MSHTCHILSTQQPRVASDYLIGHYSSRKQINLQEQLPHGKLRQQAL